MNQHKGGEARLEAALAQVSYAQLFAYLLFGIYFV